MRSPDEEGLGRKLQDYESKFLAKIKEACYGIGPDGECDGLGV